MDPVEIVIAETEPLQQRLPIELGKALAATPVPEGAHKAFGESITARHTGRPSMPVSRPSPR